MSSGHSTRLGWSFQRSRNLPSGAGTTSSGRRRFGEAQAKAARGKRGPVPQWQQQIEAVAQLPKSQQQFVARMIEMALA